MPMLIRRAVLTVILLPLLALAPAAPAGDGPAVLPQALLLHASVRSVSGLLEDVDAFAASVARGSSIQVVPGMLPMLAQLYFPLPADAWEPDGEAHFILPSPRRDKTGNAHAVFLSTRGYDEFIQALEENGIPAESDETNSCHDVAIPGIGDYVAADGGKNMILLASTLDMLNMMRDLMAGGWRPAHWGDGVLCLDTRIPAGSIQSLDIMKELARDVIGPAKESLDKAAELEEAGIDHGRVKDLLQAVETALPWFLDEANMIRAAGVDIQVDGRRASLEFSVASDPGSMLAELTDAIGGLPNADTPLTKNVGKNAMGFFEGVGAASYPQFRSRIERGVGRFLEIAFPRQKDAVMERYAELFRLTGESVSATFYHGDNESHNAVWMRSSDPVKTMAALAALFADVRGMLDSLTSSGDGFFLSFDVSDGVLPDGIPYKQGKFNLAGLDDLFKKYSVETAGIDHPLAAQFDEAMNRIRGLSFLFAAAEGQLVIVSGEADAERLAEALAASKGAVDPMTDTPAAGQTLEALRHRQLGFGLFDVRQVSLLVADAFTRAHAMLAQSDEVRAAYAEMLQDVKTRFRDAGDLYGIGVGAAGGRLTLALTATTDAVNAFWRNFVLVDRMVNDMNGRYADEALYEEEDIVILPDDGGGDGEDDAVIVEMDNAHGIATPRFDDESNRGFKEK